jgi:hypothetical protein
MRGRSKIVALIVSAVALAVAVPAASSAHPRRHDRDHGRHGHTIKHVLLISVDGLYQPDRRCASRGPACSRVTNRVDEAVAEVPPAEPGRPLRARISVRPLAFGRAPG